MDYLTGMSPLLLLLFVPLFAAYGVDRSGCGSKKLCLLRPTGCDPNLDCTMGVMLGMVGPNRLRVDMVATSIIPAVPLQYLAVAFSKDARMGDDMVSECVLGEGGIDLGGEVFLSYNRGYSNDRLHLATLDHATMFSNVSGVIVDGHLQCSFEIQVRPQLMSTHGGRVWDLDKDFFIFAATGSAQPDEVNAHDLNRDSHFFPITSPRKFDVTKFSAGNYNLPPSRLATLPIIPIATPPPHTARPPTAVKGRKNLTSSSSTTSFVYILILPLLLLLLRP